MTRRQDSPALLRLKAAGVHGPRNRPLITRWSHSYVQWNPGRSGKHEWICRSIELLSHSFRPLSAAGKDTLGGTAVL